LAFRARYSPILLLVSFLVKQGLISGSFVSAGPEQLCERRARDELEEV